MAILYIDLVNTSPDIVIVGAGLIGLSCADSLSRLGLKVTILDYRPGVAQGTSFSNSGMLHPSQARPWAIVGLNPEDRLMATEAVFALARRSVPLVRDNITALGLSRAQSEHGCYQIFDTETERFKAQGFYVDMGIQANSVRETNREMEPFCDRPALYFPEDGFGDAHAYCQALAQQLKAKGVEIKLNVDPVSITAQKDRVSGVQMGDHTLSTETVIVAAGVNSPALVRPLGFDIPMEPVTGHALDFDRPRNWDIALPSCPVMHAPSHSAFTPFETHIRLSGTVGEDNPEILQDIWHEVAPDVISRLGSPTRSWSAPRPMSKTGQPIIAQSPISGLWINTGHGHMGWTLSAGSGAVMAEMMTANHSENRYPLR